jgi:hypothetical protein
MYKQCSFHVKGMAPILVHNGALANPLNPISKMIRSFTSKKTKTDDDHEAIAKLEWLGGLYPSEAMDVTVKGSRIMVTTKAHPVIPSTVLEGTLYNSSKKQKLGEKFKSGVVVMDDAPLLYEGPKSIQKLFDEMENWMLSSIVKVQRNRIVRCRPMFRSWSLDFTVHYMPSVVNVQEIVDTVERAGQLIGLAEYGPKYGRFIVENTSNGH